MFSNFQQQWNGYPQAHNGYNYQPVQDFSGYPSPAPPTYQQSHVFQGRPEYDVFKPAQFQSMELREPLRQYRRRRFDWLNLLLLPSIWAGLALSTLVLLTLGDEDYIANRVYLSSGVLLAPTILNEMFVDRCWRRVQCAALETGKRRGMTDTQMARNLRAANMEWWAITKRLFRGTLTFSDIRAICAYCVLRLGTALAIASVHFAISFGNSYTQGNQTYRTFHKRYWWIFVPLFLHGLSVFLTLLIWLVMPWRIFIGDFGDLGYWRRYQPYLDRIAAVCYNAGTSAAGSIADYGVVALVLEGKKLPEDLRTLSQPGLQPKAKIKGIWYGLVMMNAPLGIAYAATKHWTQDEFVENRILRFGVQFALLLNNIFYVLAVDFAIWNLSLERLCRSSKQQSGGKKRHLSWLGYTSGIVLLFRAFWMGRPIRSTIFLLLFWIHSAMFRAYTSLVALAFATMQFYQPDSEVRKTGGPSEDFWLGWIILGTGSSLLVFVPWLLTSFQVPICSANGWRWAQIAKYALFEDGFYGVRNGKAVWGSDVQDFREYGRNKLE